MSKIVVFGANGFLGRHLVRKLAQDASNSIRAFDRFPEYSAGQAIYFGDLANVEVMAGNFLSKEDVSEALEDMEYVFHLISTTNPAVSANDPYIDIDTNIRASVTLFDLCTQRKVKRVLFPSSGGTVYGNIESESIDELTLPQPVSPYGIGKLTIEHYLRYFQQTKSLDYIVFRIANPYGPGQNVHGKQGVIPIFLHAALQHEPLNVYGEGTMVRDYIYIDDAIAMVTAAYDKPHQYPTYNIGSGKGSSVLEIIDGIKACTNFPIKTAHQPAPPTFVQKSVLNIDRFTSEFQIIPKTNLKTGIDHTWHYLTKP